MTAEEIDVLIVGGGLSGVGAGYFLQRDCPAKSYVILEGRDGIGGTWDLFRYPGVRSDSDMFTLGYGFKPWTGAKAIADGPSILAYVRETAREYGIDTHIRFRHRVIRAAWSSAEARWTVEAEHDGALTFFRAKFLLMCAGYYKYEEGYTPAFEGVETFAGELVHPQHWPEALDHAGKRVVIIGSGATAVTLAPAMAETAAHVVMLQRSPTYMVSMPAEDRFAHAMRRVLPRQFAYDATRFIRITMQQIFFRLSRARPKQMRKRLIGLVRARLGPDYDVETHFTPRYNPWEQRLCLVPDNDMFDAIRDGKVEIVTDQIARFASGGLELASGRRLEADIVVMATGLNLQMFGGADLLVDGAPVRTGERYAYKGALYSDVPNFASVFGYTNASWTLRADLINAYVCRLINYMDARGYDQATPRLKGAVEERPFVDFSSGYFQRARHMLPRQTTRAPWKQNQSYAHDLYGFAFRRA